MVRCVFGRRLILPELLHLQESHVGNDVRFVHSMLLDYVRVREMDQTANSKEGKVCGACKSEQLVRMTRESCTPPCNFLHVLSTSGRR